MVKNHKLNQFFKTIHYFRYRFWYLTNFIIIGFLSILLEIFVATFFLSNTPFLFRIILGFLLGMSFAFILNAKLNFKVPPEKSTRTFLVFFLVSVFAFLLNLVSISLIGETFNVSYGSSRLFTSSIIFMFSYYLHRKITFDFVKKIGIAVYLNKTENVSEIYSKIKYYSDFIHLDLVDKSFNKNAKEIDISLINQIKKTWGLSKMLHIMSKTPSVWIKKLHNDVDSILFHTDIDEPIGELIDYCKKNRKKVGLVLMPDSEINEIQKYFPKLDYVQVMGINSLGVSGKPFDASSLILVDKLNKLKNKYSFEIVFDGGVKPMNIGRINARYLVSGSSLLHSPDPIETFMKLKTNSRYHPIEKELREDILGGIKEITDSLGFIESTSIVGSFSENKGLEGMSDIDIVVICDKLTKSNFKKVYEKFDLLKGKISSKYGYPVLINNTLGPLKFNEGNIVFHLMLYDLKTHKEHCEKSPFTCLDWQRSKIFFKKSIGEIYKIWFLQPDQFFNSRRGIGEYLSEIKNNKISYRKYEFNGKRVYEKKEYKEMNERDRIEFSYHILKFTVSNFLKLYSKRNIKYNLDKILKHYFEIFPKNKKKHVKFIKKIYFLKEKRKFKEPKNLLSQLTYFLNDFEFQFKKYFDNSSTEIDFIRHAKTKSNKKNFFIGQRMNPDIIKNTRKRLKILDDELKDYDVIFSSPLKRCINTLKELNKTQKIVLNNNLIEIDYGDLDGKNLDFLSKNYPSIINDWKIGKDPKFPDGENLLDVSKRVKAFLNSIRNYSNKKILVCTHNVFLRILIGQYLRIPFKDWFKLEIPHLDKINFMKTKDNRLYLNLSNKQIETIFSKLY